MLFRSQGIGRVYACQVPRGCPESPPVEALGAHLARHRPSFLRAAGADAFDDEGIDLGEVTLDRLSIDRDATLPPSPDVTRRQGGDRM